MTVSVLSLTCFSSQAATFEDINKSSVFLKQKSSGTCTLCSVTMMLRRAAMLAGDKNWADITESAVKSTAWISGQGLSWNFTYAGITVGHEYFKSKKSTKAQLVELLKKHPEGIVIYDRDTPHAVLLTDYTDGVFYCAEPARKYPTGRIPITEAYGVKTTNAEDYWYVVSPSLKTENSIEGNEAEEEKAFAATGTVYVLGRYVTTAESGLRLRKAPVDGKKLGVIPYGTKLSLTEISDGWGKTKFDGIKGWISLDFAKSIDEKSVDKVTLSQTKYTYDGKTHKPAVTVVDTKGNKLKKDKDYTVKYASGRKKIGIYKVKVTFCGDYSGTVTLKFRITPDKVEDLKLTAKTKSARVSFDAVKSASGYEIYKATKKNGTYEKALTTKNTSVIISKLKTGKKYYIKVRAYKLVDGTKVFGSFSNIKSVTAK